MRNACKSVSQGLSGEYEDGWGWWGTATGEEWWGVWDALDAEWAGVEELAVKSDRILMEFVCFKGEKWWLGLDLARCRILS